MATYVIGDVQGCFDPFKRLLENIGFNERQDSLWFTGDLVNRGPSSLEVLRFVKALKSSRVVLGNHDLHFLAVLYGKAKLGDQDTLEPILQAPDRDDLGTWLRHRPLLYHHAGLDLTLVHAGLSPQWDLCQALQYAGEVEAAIRSQQYPEFFEHMYDVVPNRWNDGLQKWERLCVITNCLTRIRFCDVEGDLDLFTKGKHAKKGYFPWFSVPNRRSKGMKIIFGHWAALAGETNDPMTIALDTGCVWGRRLTAMRLEDGRRFSTSCSDGM